MYRSSSSGSKSSCALCTSDIRDWICVSACSSISRTWLRKRITLPVSSSRFALSVRNSPSTRARAMATSPASLTSWSTMSARTRSIAFAVSTSAWSRLVDASGAAATGAAAGAACAAGCAAVSIADAGASAGAGCASHGSGTLPLPSRNASSTNAIRSISVSSASNSSALGATGTSPIDSRDSIRCASSPRRIAPAIRALPFSVCSVRRS